MDHSKNPRHRGFFEDADVAMPGGSPECGGTVTVYLKGGVNGEIADLSWVGDGDTISQGAASILAERVHEEGLSLQQVLELDYEEFVDSVGRDVVGQRTRNATLALSTLKAAIRKHQQERRSAVASREAVSESCA